MTDSLKFKPIGIVHSPFEAKEDVEPERHAQEKGFDDALEELEILKAYNGN